MAFEPAVENSKTGNGNATQPRNLLRCGRVADLVNLAQVQICGRGHVGTRAFAEGLARLGNRSANRLGDSRPLDSAPRDSVPCVYHCFTGNDSPVPHRAAIVLVAGTHQDAVDHCVVAQSIAADLQVPVHCLVDSGLQDYLGFVELPTRMAFLRESNSVSAPAIIDVGKLLPGFESASATLGREHKPVLCFGPNRARQVLIVCGREAAQARTLLEQGCFSDDARLLQIELLRPLPEAELVGLLQNAQQLVILAQPGNPIGAELFSALEILVADNPKIPKPTFAALAASDMTPQSLSSALPDSYVGPNLDEKDPATLPAVMQLEIGVYPPGKWGRELLTNSASAIVRSTSPAIQRELPQIIQHDNDPSVSRLGIGVNVVESDALDVLIHVENDLFEAKPAVERLKQNGILIFVCEGHHIGATWNDLPTESRSLISKKNVEIWCLCPRDLLEPMQDIASPTCQLLSGALLTTLSAKLKLDRYQLDSAQLSNLERTGLQSVYRFNPSDHVVDQSRPANISCPGTTNESGQTQDNEKNWRDSLRAFHLTGSGDWSALEPLPGLPLWPAVAESLVADLKLTAHYPIILPSAPDKVQLTECVSLYELLQSRQPAGKNESPDYQHELETTVHKIEAIAGQNASWQVSEIVSAAVQDISANNGEPASDAALRDVLSQLPESGTLVGLGSDTLSKLYTWASATGRENLRNRFYVEVEQLIVGLQELLQLGQVRGESLRSPESLAATMGAQATEFVDLEKLSRNLPDADAFQRLSDSRVALIRETLGVLEAFGRSNSRFLTFFMITSGTGPKFAELPSTAKFVTPDCFTAALGVVDGLLEQMARVFRAVRVARLLVSGRYQEEKHDDVFSRFQWQSCNDEEILLGPRVLVVESSSGIREKQTEESLNRLLRSGRPVHVLITQDESGLAEEELGGALEDLGAMAMANREALVFQSTLARPEHLLSGLREMFQTARPSIALVSSHPMSQTNDWAWACELLSLYGRIAPCFRYSPDRGQSWSERIDVAGNPQCDVGQPVVTLTGHSLTNAIEPIDEAVTFAHAAALQPQFRDHFRVIPNIAWSDDQQPIGAYLDQFESLPPASIPYIWVLRNGMRCRAIMTREMANVCRDRLRAWRGLQDLAVINSAYVSKTRDDVRQELEACDENETERARFLGWQEGTTSAVNSIVGALLGNRTPGAVADFLLGTIVAEPSRSEASTAPATSDESNPEKSKSPSLVSSEKAYIESELCTSCNDCLKINPLLFVYNVNNQAEIGDPMAGSFAELVKAAEQCPARCIHPGLPRPDDKTATSAIIKRAEKFQ